VSHFHAIHALRNLLWLCRTKICESKHHLAVIFQVFPYILEIDHYVLIMAGMYSGYMRNGPGMMGVMDRPPMTREEFLEVQERQRQERHRQHRMMEHPERFVGITFT
jgi:hypothetical protein